MTAQVLTLGDVQWLVVQKGPGHTEAQLAEAVYGSRGSSQEPRHQALVAQCEARLAQAQAAYSVEPT